MKSYQILALLALLLGCAGEPFVTFSENRKAVGGADIQGGQAGDITVDFVDENSSYGANGGNWSRKPTSGKQPDSHAGDSAGGMAGESFGGSSNIAGEVGAGGSPDQAPTWMCHQESGLCQCYSDSSSGSNINKCLPSNLCTARGVSACVCWDTEIAYQGALANPEFRVVESCP